MLAPDGMRRLANSHAYIVFDLDGTLIDTAPDLIDALNFIFTSTDCPPSRSRDRGPLIGGARGA